MAATLRASTQGLDIVDKARRAKGWAKTSQEWADLATTSKATLRRFWAGVPIQSATFKEICKAIGIKEWKRIADFTELARRPKSQMPAQPSRRLAFAIAGSIEEIDKRKLDAIVALLNKIGGDMSIEILDVEEGSIKLILSGSPAALSRIEALYRAGQLQEVSNVPVRYVAFERQQRSFSDRNQVGSTYRTLKSRENDSRDSARNRARNSNSNLGNQISWDTGFLILLSLLVFVLILRLL